MKIKMILCKDIMIYLLEFLDKREIINLSSIDKEHRILIYEKIIFRYNKKYDKKFLNRIKYIKISRKDNIIDKKFNSLIYLSIENERHLELLKINQNIKKIEVWFNLFGINEKYFNIKILILKWVIINNNIIICSKEYIKENKKKITKMFPNLDCIYYGEKSNIFKIQND